MNIGEAAARSGVPAKTIRYYEDIALIESADRNANGYRAYSDEDVHTLRFIASARSLGFTVAQCRDLLALYRDRERSSADVKAIAANHVAEIDEKIESLRAMRATLSTLMRKCHGDERPDCPIIEELASGAAPETDAK
ncbi:Cu(I)-responsive transcriptional regulator [Parvibaculum sp.]|jgi:Cu(I)-responsive transcriptional regulator|uniref:Cu(I)-responsive transcriptional regulator n=1 Tax=Parvibaculum sp. TaxID=2024848 RepID=UPI000C559959|nr:Cu(I)-responsive transcriptional regulator [Parvibaculum sp.]HAC57565.1 Cu(I)-responsive transcriptional regulator [Rhodobiaceae bacterium]MAU62550.1 Cu(I)-responsive transcriptional regulator [Parvibaculum sp.]MBO6666511.1 Cu(I)-responsive transcriptional regulator [Parvibaculum sp.]MBO6690894.1 Cu(I)-responsive transcriptional regulator [Parvibaculum sp.]MBO6713132.1 Cu(I)-responsive transcriptional regulator [Parvibaculum sp.]|tara:strand:- start:1914 stop:2327 length:414 start_codon:yes stop_codon:yes gene_type:complete